MTSDDACRHAGEILLRAGFQLRHRSLKSEACYYVWPDRRGLLRIAAHAGRGEVIDGQPIIAKLTFGYASPRDAQKQSLVLTMDQLEAQTAAAIGRFMIASGYLLVTTPDPG
jgi:hypothetical protein